MMNENRSRMGTKQTKHSIFFSLKCMWREANDFDGFRRFIGKLSSLLLLLALILPIPQIVSNITFSNLSGPSTIRHALFLIGYLSIVCIAIVVFVKMWMAFRNDANQALFTSQKKWIQPVIFFAPWMWIACYELFLFRQPVDLMNIFVTIAFLLSLIHTTTLPNRSLSQFSTFCVFLVEGLLVIQSAFTNPIPLSLWENFYTLKPDSLDVVLIGNSHIQHFDYEFIEASLGVPTYVVGNPGLGMHSAYYQIKQVVQTQKIDLLIVDASMLRSWEDENSLFPWNLSSQQALRGIPFLEGAFNNFSVGDYPKVFFPLLYYHSNWSEGDFDMMVLNVLSTYFAVKPNAPILRILSIDQIPGPETPKDRSMEDASSPLKESEVDALYKILRLCKDRHIDVWLVEAPTVWTFITSPDTPVTQLAERENLVFMNYNDNTYGHFSRVHFWDREHLNDFGIAVTAMSFSEILSKQLNIPIREDVYTQHRAILVEDLLTDLQGDQITYTLDMVEDGSPDAEFTWRVTDHRGSVLVDVPYSDQNYVTFTLPAEGHYIIKMTVRNREHPEIRSDGILTERYEIPLEREWHE